MIKMIKNSFLSGVRCEGSVDLKINPGLEDFSSVNLVYLTPLGVRQIHLFHHLLQQQFHLLQLQLLLHSHRSWSHHSPLLPLAPSP